MDDSQNTSFENLGLGPSDVAFQEALRGAQEGAVHAQSNVALFYATGTGVQQDYSEALKWWRRAGEQGDVSDWQSI